MSRRENTAATERPVTTNSVFLTWGRMTLNQPAPHKLISLTNFLGFSKTVRLMAIGENLDLGFSVHRTNSKQGEI